MTNIRARRTLAMTAVGVGAALLVFGIAGVVANFWLSRNEPRAPDTFQPSESPDSVKTTIPEPKFALRLTSDDVSYAMLENSQTVIPFDRSFTLELWCRWDPASPPPFIVGQGGFDMTQRVHIGWSIRLQSASEGKALLIPSYCDGGVAFPLNRTDDWRHIALCVNDRGMVVYDNGHPARNGIPIGYSVKDRSLNDNPFPVVLGFRPPYGSLPSSIDIRSFRISSKVKYEGEFFPPATLLPELDTLALFDFTHETGSTIQDGSGNRHHARLVRASWITLADDAQVAAIVPRSNPGVVWRGVSMEQFAQPVSTFRLTGDGWRDDARPDVRFEEAERTDEYLDLGIGEFGPRFRLRPTYMRMVTPEGRELERRFFGYWEGSDDAEFFAESLGEP